MRNVTASVIIKAHAELIIQSFLESKHMVAWWKVSRALVEPCEGGVWTLAWEISEEGIKYVSSGLITKYIKGEYLRISNLVYLNPARQILGPMELELKVMPVDKNSCMVNLLQSGYQYGEDWDWYYQAVLQAWPYALNLLKEYLENSATVKD